MSVVGTDARLLTARNAVAVSFAINGFAFANWATRIPETRQRLGLDNGQLGLLLLCMSIGSVVAMPTAGALVHRFQPAGVVRIGTGFNVVGLLGITLGAGVLEQWWITGLGMAAYGVGTAVWDVAMNVEAAEVERRIRRTIMPKFHAAFSAGTVLGAGLGALTVALGTSMTVHLPFDALVVLLVSLTSVVGFLPGDPTSEETAEPSSVGRAWLEPRTLLVGLMVLALALAEGSANDWLAIALQDGYDAAHSVAVLGYGAFVTAMTVGRMVGPALLDRFGRAPVLWGTMAAAMSGLVLLVYGGTPWLVVPGILLWGLGASLGFPVGMSAAADDPAHAAARVSVVSTIGYTAFLAGPPLLGFVGDRVGSLEALLVVAVLLVPAALAVPYARKR